MITEIERAWLAGIIDGEGSISLFSNQEKSGSIKIKPVINFVNTDLGIVNEALSILHKAGCKPYIVNRRQSTKNSRHRDVVEVKASSVPEVKKFLELVAPYLKGEKKHKAEILLRYVSRREEKFKLGDYSYDEDDWQDLTAIRSSQTTREAPISNSTVW